MVYLIGKNGPFLSLMYKLAQYLYKLSIKLLLHWSDKKKVVPHQFGLCTKCLCTNRVSLAFPSSKSIFRILEDTRMSILKGRQKFDYKGWHGLQATPSWSILFLAKKKEKKNSNRWLGDQWKIAYWTSKIVQLTLIRWDSNMCIFASLFRIWAC